jgi:hypothetical protein
MRAAAARRLTRKPARIWDADPALLCDRHLLGEHRELHAIWSILTTGDAEQTELLESVQAQRERLARHSCGWPG